MALKWHPDRNKSEYATQMMQDINEAYKILSDDVLRKMYDREYMSIMNYNPVQDKKPDDENGEEEKKPPYNYQYVVQDESLREAIRMAREEAQKKADDYFFHGNSNSNSCSWETILGGMMAAALSALVKYCSS